MLRITAAALLTVGAGYACSQLEPPKPTPLVGARSLALSPDGSRLAFSYQGDIWVAPTTGGRAIPVTNHVEMDDNPVWSPDGKWIAFVTNRHGNNDIYVVPADGGQSRRITYHTGSDVPADWSPDGKSILVRATRDDRHNGVYAIDVKTGRNQRLFLDMMTINNPSLMSDGKSVLYNRFGFPWTRARYEGSAAAQLWRYDLSTGKRTELRNNGFQHLWPTSIGNTVFTVTVSEKTPSSSYVGKPIPRVVDNVRRTPNVYAIDSNGRERRLTNFVGMPVRFLTAAKSANLLAFENDGDVYTMAPGQEPRKVEIIATLDDKTTQHERLILREGAGDYSFSPKGDKVVFMVRGELWMMPTKKDPKDKSPNKDDATQLTTWEGRDAQPLWAPDNVHLFFVSDREGAERMYRMNTETKQVSPVTRNDADVAQLRLTPDKKKVSFWMSGKDGGLYTVPVDGGEPTRVLARPGGVQYYAWSPDGRFVAYSETLLRSGFYYWESTNNIFVYDLVNKTLENVTKLSATHLLPAFTPDGKYLLFRSNRNGEGLYALPLSPEDARETELDMKYEKPTGPVKVEIQYEDIELRARRISSTQPQSAILVDPEKGDLYFLNGGDVWRTAYNGDDARKLTNGGGFADIEPADDWKTLVGVRNGKPVTVDIRKGDTPVTVLDFRADWTRDVKKEREAAFMEFYRAYNRGFYDANFHGRDWTALREKYRKYLPSIGHRNEMSTVLNMLIGELEASHTEVGTAAGNPSSQSVAHLGFTFDYSHSGPGIKVLDVPARSPGSYPKTRIEPGEIVLKVNGTPVQPDESLYHDVLSEQDGRDAVLTVQGKDGKVREVKYRLMSPGGFSSLVFDNLLRKRREFVEKASGGKLTYVHIAGMGEGPLNRFNQEVWMHANGKQGLIIDVRNNGGGNTADRIIDVLERAPNMIYQVRDEAVQLGPGQALAMPMVVMMGETSYSNAEMFPAAMKARKLATLVGRPTPGYVIYTYGGQLVDGTPIRMPSTGVYRLDGSPMENMGQQPDVNVDISPEDYFAGRDPQLEKAIEVLLKQIK